MAYIIDSLQNYQQQLVDHFKADELRRSSFQKHMRNSRFKEVMARSRVATGPAHAVGTTKRDGRKIHGPPQGQDPVEYYRERLQTRKKKVETLRRDSTQPASPASAPTGRASTVQGADQSDLQVKPAPTAHGACTYVRAERPWTERTHPRKSIQLTAEEIRETLKNVYSTTGATNRKTAPYKHYDGRATAGLPLRLNEMQFKTKAAARGDTARGKATIDNNKHAQVILGQRSKSPTRGKNAAQGQTERDRSARRPEPPERPPDAEAATAAAPPDHARRVKPTWRPGKAACEPLAASDSNVDRWAAAAPWRERPGEHAGDDNCDAGTPDSWPFRILQPRPEKESDVGVRGFHSDVCASSARSMNAEATTSRSRKLDAQPEGGGWETARPEAVARARASRSTTYAWSVAPPITDGGRVEYRYHSETQRPVSAVALTADRQLDAPARASTASPQLHRRFAFPSKGGPRAVQSAR